MRFAPELSRRTKPGMVTRVLRAILSAACGVCSARQHHNIFSGKLRYAVAGGVLFTLLFAGVLIAVVALVTIPHR